MDLRFSVCLPRDRASVPIIRRLCRSALRDLGVSEGCIEDIALALTEACTNVLKHAALEDGDYQVDIKIDESECEISVADTGVGFDVESARTPAPVLAAESGRGLHLMSVLVDDLKFISRPSDGGTVVRLLKFLDFTDQSALRLMATAQPRGGTPGDDRLRRNAHLY